MAVALAGNNPGGINDGSFAQSQPGYVGANGRYAAFATMADGAAAQTALLQSYINRGFNTPATIAARWAPSADGNNTAAYAQSIASKMGIGVNSTITSADLAKFQAAQASTENSAYNGTGAGTNSASVPDGGTSASAAQTAADAGSEGGIAGAITSAVNTVNSGTKNLFTRGAAVFIGAVVIAAGLFFLADQATDGGASSAVKKAAVLAA